MIKIRNYEPFNIVTIAWKEKLEPPKWWTYRGLRHWFLRQPDTNWRIFFKEPDSLLQKKRKPIYITEDEKDWLDRQIKAHNVVCDLVNHRQTMSSVYGAKE